MNRSARWARAAGAAGLALLVTLAPARADAPDPAEPQVLTGPDAASFARMLAIRSGQAGRPFAADVVVIMFEPAGLVRVVLIDLAGGRKAWVALIHAGLMQILGIVGEGA